jgi:hypothetical protein
MPLGRNNTLDNLIPYLYTARDVVSREMADLIRFVSRDATADMAAEGQTINVPKTRKRDVHDIGDTPPSGSGNDFGTIPIVIDHFKVADPIVWNGEEERGVGDKLNQMRLNQFVQAIRSLVNNIEDNLAYKGILAAITSGNVYGAAGTPPFSGSLTDMAGIAKMFDDIGAPQTERAFIGNSTAIRQMRSLGILTAADQAGSDITLRTGRLLSIFGFAIGQSGGFKRMEPGAGTGYTINGAQAQGNTTLTVDGGSGAINKGALITIAGDPNKYIVTDDVSSGGTAIKISGGLKQAAADNVAITIGTAYIPSLAFTSDALVLAARQPYLPMGGDEADDVLVLTDEFTGLSFQAALYPGYRKKRIEIAICYGIAAPNAEHILTVLG